MNYFISNLNSNKMEQLFGINPIETKKYDGSNFPSIVNEILRKYKNKAFFGGGSLIHDAFFKDEHWQSRVDYDIWCNDSIYQNIISDLIEKNFNMSINSKYSNKYYEKFNIKELTEFTFEIDKKEYIIQLINIGNYFLNLINKIDFTFNTVFYNGEELIFFRTTEADVLQKRGYLQVDVITNECECEECKNKNISQKQIQRIEKYKSRGFHITNFCPFCETIGPEKKYKIITVLHFQTCVLNLADPLYILRLNDDQFEKIIHMGYTSNNSDVILCCLNIIARTLHMEEFISLFHEKKHLLDIHTILFNDILIDFTVQGQYTFFKLFFDLLKIKTSIIETNIQILFRKACYYNCINIALYISSHSDRYELSIFEDKIYEHNILTVFEHYVKYKNIQIILDEYPGKITILDEDSMNQEEDTICSICNANPSNIRLRCGHRFCDCIFNYFAASCSMKCGICHGEN